MAWQLIERDGLDCPLDNLRPSWNDWEPNLQILLTCILRLILTRISQKMKIAGNEHTLQIILGCLTGQLDYNCSLLVLLLQVFTWYYESTAVGYSRLLSAEASADQVMTKVA